MNSVSDKDLATCGLSNASSQDNTTIESRLHQ
jgi:hypothetical protein